MLTSFVSSEIVVYAIVPDVNLCRSVYRLVILYRVTKEYI